MSYDNTNKGIIGKNTRKEQDSHPDLSGSINIEGKEYWLSGWKKERNDGTGIFYSLAAKPKEAKGEQKQQKPAPQQGKPEDQFDDDIPF
jgi:hypothetical protein